MLCLLSAVAAGSALLSLPAEASRLTPPVLPLVVRNPYLSTWLDDARGDPWNRWPMFWTGESVRGLPLALLCANTAICKHNAHADFNPLYSKVFLSWLQFRAPETSIPSLVGLRILWRWMARMMGMFQSALKILLGCAWLSLHRYNVSFATYLGASFDASTTNLTYHIPNPPSIEKATPPLELVLSFLSPITPTSTLRQSIPASYLTVEVKGSFSLDLYIDLNGQWASGDRQSEIVWDLGQQELGSSGKGLKTWRIRKETEALFSEVRDQAEWGTLHFTAPSVGRRKCITLELAN